MERLSPAENEEILEEPEGEALDPRVQVELEKLNRSSEEINTLELLLDDARSEFRTVLTESTYQLNVLSKKLGSCIEKARPYYDARIKSKEAHIETQKAALRFERACSQQTAAKEMVNLAEQGFFKKGQPFDPAWQEMLNHATQKVNDAEQERIKSELEHLETTSFFKDWEDRVNELHRKLRRSVNKSRPYFEMKAKFNQRMEEQKRHVGHLESAMQEAKQRYSDALRCLESISDQIHRQRHEANIRKEMGHRGSGVGAETPEEPPANDNSFFVPHPLMSGPNDRDEENITQSSKTRSSGEKPRPKSIADLPQVLGVTEGQSKIKVIETDPLGVTTFEGEPLGGVVIGRDKKKCNPGSVPGIKLTTPGSETSACSSTAAISPRSSIAGISPRSSIGEAMVVSPDAEVEGGAVAERTRRTNAEVMASLQAAKDQRGVGVKGLFLRSNRSSRDELEELGRVDSDCGSQAGSIASILSVMDDEQIEGLMIETGEYVSYLSMHAAASRDDIDATMTLPPRLSYLQDRINFQPQWLPGDDEKNNAKVSSSELNVDNTQLYNEKSKSAKGSKVETDKYVKVANLDGCKDVEIGNKEINSEKLEGKIESVPEEGDNATVTDSNAKVTDSNAKVTDSNATVTDSNAKVTDSNAKVTDPNAKVTKFNVKLQSEVPGKSLDVDILGKLETEKNAKVNGSDAKMQSEVPGKDLNNANKELSNEKLKMDGKQLDTANDGTVPSKEMEMTHLNGKQILGSSDRNVATCNNEVKTNRSHSETGEIPVETYAKEVKTGHLKQVKTDLKLLDSDVKPVKTDLKLVDSDVKHVKTDVKDLTTSGKTG